MSGCNGALCSLAVHGLFGHASSPPAPIRSTSAVGLLQLWKWGTVTQIHISQGETLGNVEGNVAPSCSSGRWWPRAPKAGRCHWVIEGPIFFQLIQPA